MIGGLFLSLQQMKHTKALREFFIIGPVSITEGNWHTGEYKHTKVYPK